MHRSTIGLTIALMVAVAIGGLVLQGCSSSTAADQPCAKAGMASPKTMPCPMHGKMGKEQMMSMCPMCHMMMMGKSMIATTDGGVVVMIGDKLMKFDRDLNLVKETKIKMDIEDTQKPCMVQPVKEGPPHKGAVKKSCPMKKDSEK